MRMWMVDPKTMCRKHLLGEHYEIHMLIGSMRRGKSIAKYIETKLLQPSAAAKRHDELVAEMANRGYTHHTPVGEHEIKLLIDDYPPEVRTARVDRSVSVAELHERCEGCARQARLVATWKRERGKQRKILEAV